MPHSDPLDDKIERDLTAGATEQDQRERLQLREWQIFFGYASHFVNPLPPLNDVARNLVENGVAESTFVSDGEAWWSIDDPVTATLRVGKRSRKVGHGRIDLSMRADGRHAKLAFPPMARGYAQEGLASAARLRYHEEFLFGHDNLPPRYVRGQLGLCCFADDESKLYVYPQIKIFENGVVLVYFRMFSPSDAQPLDRFLTRYVNASLSGFRRLLVSPGVAYWSTLAAPSSGVFRWHQRPRTAWEQRHHGELVVAETNIEKANDFSFALTSVSTATEAAVLRSAKEALAKLEPVISEQARKQVGLTGDAMTDAESFVRAVNKHRKDCESEDDTIGRLEDEYVEAVRVRAEDAGKKITDSAIRYLREQEKTFSGLALTLMAVAGYVAGTGSSGPRSLIKVAIAGPGRPNTVGNHWGGHHHVHLIRFRGQRETASENERIYGADFGSIIARVVIGNDNTARSMLPKSSRLFDDLGAYLARNGSLWVQPHIADVPRDAETDPNRGDLVEEHHVKAEMLDYAYALHRRIAEEATVERATVEDILTARKALADFEMAVHDASHFGEVRDLLQTGLKAYAINEFRIRAEEAVRIREAIATHTLTRSTQRFATMLSLLVGSLALPSLATSVVEPLWAWLGWPAPSRTEPRQLMFILIASVVVLCLILLGSWWARRVRPFRGKRRAARG